MIQRETENFKELPPLPRKGMVYVKDKDTELSEKIQGQLFPGKAL